MLTLEQRYFFLFRLKLDAKAHKEDMEREASPYCLFSLRRMDDAINAYHVANANFAKFVLDHDHF